MSERAAECYSSLSDSPVLLPPLSIWVSPGLWHRPVNLSVRLTVALSVFHFWRTPRWKRALIRGVFCTFLSQRFSEIFLTLSQSRCKTHYLSISHWSMLTSLSLATSNENINKNGWHGVKKNVNGRSEHKSGRSEQCRDTKIMSHDFSEFLTISKV
jgi:hypothetical protein